MIEVTSYELTTYVARAACAAGLAEGEATVLAGIVQTMLAAGTDCVALLLAALDALDNGGSARPVARIVDGAATLGTADHRPISAAIAACQIFDLLRSDGIDAIRLGPVDHPVFIRGALDSVARCGGPTAVLAGAAGEPASTFEIRIQRPGGELPTEAAARRRVALPEPAWDSLQRRSARLYVPETERSRRLGAGADAASAAPAMDMVGSDG